MLTLSKQNTKIFPKLSVIRRFVSDVIVLDTETTGLEKDARLVQLGWIKFKVTGEVVILILFI
jgi:DNA polymerase III epsilon subunit-like protein